MGTPLMQKGRGVENLRMAKLGEVGYDSPATKSGYTSPSIIAGRAEEIADRLREVIPGFGPEDEHMMITLARVLARIELAHEHLEKVGITSRTGKYRHILLRDISTMENTAVRLGMELGLTPRARATMALDIAKAWEMSESVSPTDDPLTDDAIELVQAQQRASVNMLQRQLRIGHVRASRLIDTLERRGIISGFDGSLSRCVLTASGSQAQIAEMATSAD